MLRVEGQPAKQRDSRDMPSASARGERAGKEGDCQPELWMKVCVTVSLKGLGHTARVGAVCGVNPSPV